ncbi:MAG: adenylate kinase [Ekhidna sp.]|nr:adenylate kinase [Ekhidna sp.]MBC6410978.1 adenylate kinase [Ekhidna sp.]MBC6425469.1 adenylate kinase [Ekhidna sp.]
MLNIVLFGPPGAGKGTQSSKIIDKYSLIHISTGDLFRKHMNENTVLGQSAKRYIDAGNLVPDDVVIGMVEDKIRENLDANGFIFDGFPRTVNQADALDIMLKTHGLSISGTIALEVPEENLKNRIRERAKTSGRADDQDDKKINNRIAIYNNETAPVAEYYKKQDKFAAVNGVGSIDSVFESIAEKISSF